jgi:hypothetical protein
MQILSQKEKSPRTFPDRKFEEIANYQIDNQEKLGRKV